MIEQLNQFATSLGVTPEVLVIFGIGLGVILVFFGIASVLSNKNPAADRIAAGASSSRYQERMDRGLLRETASNKGLFAKSLLPNDEKKRSELQQMLAQAGYPSTKALVKFTAVRATLALLFPSIFLLLVFVSKIPGVVIPLVPTEFLGEMSNFKMMQTLTILVVIGYFGPLFWLRSRITERQRRVEESFPNALDLMQISVDSGLGFDAAMTRVGNELVSASPEIAFEFLSVQMQVQAGRDRDAAMHDMANRTGVETVRSFANVVQQSMQFGTSMSEALTTYAEEMRLARETKAQEMANKLPVKMSAVLASLMLPALIMLTLGPTVIRYIRYYGGG